MKTKQCLTWIIGCWFAMALTGLAGSQWAASNLTTVDTRGVNTGSLTGLVQGGGKPVANAQARIDGTVFTATTGTDGRFTLANVPAGSGYLLKVSGAGFATKSVPGITVTGITKDLGTIQLSPLVGPYQLVPLQPDVNPAVTLVEDGGVGYRYYRVVTADGKAAAGGVALTLRIAGGTTIPQGGDTSDSWAGRVAGVSDDTGIVRLRVPSSALNAGVQSSCQVVESGAVKVQFQAAVVKFWHDKVWKQRLEAGVSGKKAIVKLGVDGALETEVRNRYAGSLLLDETIQRTRDLNLEVGVEFDFPGPSLNSVEIGASGVGGFKVIDTYVFPPETSDQLLNMEKVYMSLGDEMSVVLGPAPQIYDELRKVYAPDLYAAILQSTEGEIHAGGKFNAGVELGVGSAGSMDLSLGVDMEGSIIGYFQANNKYQLGRLIERMREFGLRTELSGSLSASAGGNELSATLAKKLGVNANMTQSGSMAGKVWLDPATSAPISVGAEFEYEVGAGLNSSLLGWQGVGGTVGTDESMSAKESLSYDLPSKAAYAHIQALSPVWNYLVGSFGPGWRLTGQAGSGLWPAILVASEQDGVPLSYERSLYRGVTTDMAAQADLDKILKTLGLKFDASMERGAEAVVEKGVIWQRQLMPLKWRPDTTATLLPAENIVKKEVQWIGYAASPLAQAWNRMEQVIAAAGDTLIQAGTGTYHAALQFSQGAMDAGSYIVTKWVSNVAGSVGTHITLASSPRDHRLLDSSSASLVYGIGGIYRFESTNVFNGSATLSLSYSATEVAGLNPEGLRVFTLPDGTNRWQLVGGTVNTASNTVSVTITNLGTYTLAPPMPAGDLQLITSSNTLAADGVSQMTVVVTNLMLNTGNAATQQWVYTANANGVSILNPDTDATTPGVQVLSTNGAVTLLLRAPVGGSVAYVSLTSVVGDAFGSVAINLIDDVPPTVPANVLVSAGQSRVWVSWQTNSEPDLAGYRVYYRMGTNGPPWDGTATVEGLPSPVTITGTNCLLRGLTLGTNYFVAVSAVDTTGNESPLSTSQQVTTTQKQPSTPTAIMTSFGVDGTNIIMWALSEDDGYNDRDVVRYEVWRAVMPGGSYIKVGEVEAGIGLFSETNTVVGATQYVAYAVSAVDASGLSSGQVTANRVSSVELRFGTCQPLPGGEFQLSVYGEIGRGYVLQAATDLTNWTPVLNFTCTNAPNIVVDSSAATNAWRFYRVVTP